MSTLLKVFFDAQDLANFVTRSSVEHLPYFR
jgi:hypothetical protein